MKRERTVEKEILRRFERHPYTWLVYKRSWCDEHGNQFGDFPEWTDVEVAHLSLLKDEGVLQEIYEPSTELTHHPEDNPSEYLLRLTAKGHDKLETISWRYFVRNVFKNIPTIIVSVFTAVLVGWAAKLLGL